MRSLPAETINSVISLLNQGHSQRDVAKALGISKGPVSSIKGYVSVIKGSVFSIKKRHFSSNPGPTAGRPVILNDRTKRNIVRSITSGQVDTATDAAKLVGEDLQMRIRANTVRRCLKEAGLKSAVKVKKPLLRPKHLRDRLAFAKKYKE